jgi:predicted transposase YdaD
MTRHFLILDEVWDTVPDQAKTALAYARNVSQTGYFNALAALAKSNTVSATEMNIGAMEGRLDRIRAKAQNMEAVQIALQQFEAMSQFGEEISQIAHEVGLNVTQVEELVAEATSRHLEVLAEVYDQVPEHAQPAIESVMSRMMIRHQRRVQELEQQGANVPQSPEIPDRIQERLQERMQQQEGLQEQQQEQQMEGTSGATTSSMPGVSNGVHGGQ